MNPEVIRPDPVRDRVTVSLRCGVGLAAAWVIALPGVGGVGALALALLCALGLAVLAVRDWRAGIISFFLWIAVEDLFRKFHFNYMSLYFVKDVLLFCTYAGFVLHSRIGVQGIRGLFSPPLLVVIAWAVVRCIPQAWEDPQISLLGIRMWFVYVPLMVLGSAYIRQPQDLDRLLKVLVGVAVGVALLGIVQAGVGKAWLNPPLQVADERALIRWDHWGWQVSGSNSVFRTHGRFALFLFFMGSLALGWLGIRLHRGGRWGIGLAAICWFVLLAGLGVSAIKTAILLSVLSVPVWLWGLRRIRGVAVVWAVLGSVVLCGVIASSASRSVESTVMYYVYELLPLDLAPEILDRPGQVLQSAQTAAQRGGLLGFGTGTASRGLEYLQGIDPRRIVIPGVRNVGIEGGFASVLWEWGWIGGVLWVLMSVWVVLECVRATRSLRGSPAQPLAFCFTVFSTALLFPYFAIGVQACQDFVVASGFWFFLGILRAMGRKPEGFAFVCCTSSESSVHSPQSCPESGGPKSDSPFDSGLRTVD